MRNHKIQQVEASTDMSNLAMATASSPTPTDQRSPHLGLSIVSALVNGVQVPVACPAAWCAEKHSAENVRHIEDIDHNSDNVDSYAPDFRSGGDQLFAYAHLGQDLYSADEKMRAAHVRVEDGGGEASYLTPGQADTFAKSLNEFAAHIRGLAQTARGPKVGAPGHFPWCDTSACTTYDGEDGPVIEHRSRAATIKAPEGFSAAHGRILHAYLFTDDDPASRPAVSATDATGNGTLLDAAALERLIDETANALDQLRTMRLHMQEMQA